jgi:alginate O-acetyltransferase complex protein AlgI
MLFNSYEYILAFLPVTVIVYLLLGRASRSLALVWVIVASVVFYAWWRPWNLAIIGPSIAVNWFLARWLLALAGDAARTGAKRWVLTAGLVFNLLVLGYFKYANFAVGIAGDLTGSDFVFRQVVLPLGISFITFQKIAFLIDVAGGRIKSFTLRDFLLFVMFFPQLIAGPIIHYPETIPQFQTDSGRFRAHLFATAVTLFIFGLFKKVVLADGMAAYVSPVYAYAAAGHDPTMVQSWLAAVGFTLQIYFDFSGYSDMACGAALLFGIRLPLNFDSPLRATSIVDFWLRWHVTLTRFLTAYVYNPIALTLTRRRALARAPMLKGRGSPGAAFLHVLVFPTVTTMFLSGLWHGAGYTYIVWGVVHGAYLAVNHAWRQYGPRRGAAPTALGGLLGWALTFGAVCVAMVIFRAPSIGAAGSLFEGMAGLHGLGLPNSGMQLLGDPRVTTWEFLPAALYLVGLFAIAVLLPNSLQVLAAHEPVLYPPARAPRIAGVGPEIRWNPTLPWMLVVMLLATVAMFRLTGQSEFLYWQF